jgi:hypothetical protein
MQEEKMIKMKKMVKRGSVRVVKRGKLIGDFTDQAKHMTKRQLIDHMVMINKPDNPTYIISKKFLNRIYGMTDEDIRQAMDRSKSEFGFKHDLKSYYQGKLSPEDVISKWKSKGIQTKSDVDILSTKDIYDLTGRFNEPKKIKEQHTFSPSTREDEVAPTPEISLTSKPTGQRSLAVSGYGIYTTYRSMRSFLEKEVRNGKMTDELKNHYLTSYLLDVAVRRPEFAAHIAYILNGGDVQADMSTILKSFTGLKDKFIHMIKMYKLQRSRDPEYQRRLQEKLKNLDMQSKLEYTNPSYGSKFIAGPDKYRNMNPEVIDGVEYNDYAQGDRKRKRTKILPKRQSRKIVKKSVKKVVNRKPIRCRCK